MGVALGCKDVISALNRMKSNIDSKQFPAVSRAAAYAIENVSNGPFLEVIRERRDVLVDGLASLGWDVERPKATFYVWAPIPGGGSSIGFASRLLEEAGVLAIPGVGYGAHGEGYIRMSLTVIGDQHGDRAREAVRRIKAAGIGVRA